jgi:hypothetical protein
MSMNRRKFLEDSSKVLSASLIAGGMSAAESRVQTPKSVRKYRLIAAEAEPVCEG